MDRVECVVVGAGAVGLAIARALAQAGREILLIEAAATLGAGTSGRGSGVVHAGLYYEPGSLKARFCVEGRALLYAFAEGHGVPVRKSGKLVVATTAEEETTLRGIAERARANGVDDVAWLDGAEARKLEPALTCTAALLSPSTGVVDAAALLQALQDDAETFGAVSAFEAPLLAARRAPHGFTLDIGGAAPMQIACRHLVNAAGHGAPAVARAVDGLPADRIPIGYFAKGNYFALDRPAPFSHLIYPVPVPGGVGTHLTLGLDGVARFGPDVEWIEGLEYGVDPGRGASFYADIRRWWPDLPEGSLQPSHAGIRPKIAPPGAPARDFVIEDAADHGVAGLINLFGIESPGLTSALAIGAHVAAQLAV